MSQGRGPTDAAGAAPVLALTGITKRFGDVSALHDVSLTVRAGTVHALLGENGAGKTTLMRVAFGMIRPDAGTIHVDGLRQQFPSPAEALAAGIGMVHQHFTLIPAMTVAENLALGQRGRYSARAAARAVADVSALTGFALAPDATVATLSVGAQQRVEIAKALVRRARVLVLDEPTGVLAPPEIDELLRWVREFVALGHSVVLITHKLREALAVADEVTVLRQGRLASSGPARDMTEGSLTVAMIGDEVQRGERRPVRSVAVLGPVMFRAESIGAEGESGAPGIRDASFEIRAGETVGVAGVEGSGQRELLRMLAGRLVPTRGTLERPAHVGFVPEDRHHDAVLLERTLTENVGLRGAGARRGMMDWRAVRARTTALMSAFDVRASGADVLLRTLSGGNQQKLVIARELERGDGQDMPALVVENPTRGLDVRAAAAVHGQLRDAADRGDAVVIYSADLDEVLALASRVLVVFGGTVRSMPADREAIGRAMLGLG